jgi:zinc protease
MKNVTNSVAFLMFAAACATAQRAPVSLPTKPEVPAAKPIVYPTFTLDSLANGLRFAVVENHELPLVSVQTGFAGVGPLGSSFLDTPDKLGGWSVMLTMLREGTSTRTLAQITDEALDLGTTMQWPGAPAFSPPAFRAARSTWKPSLALLADALMNPSFPEASFTRLKAQIATNLDRIPPTTIANRILYGRLYGGEGPYAQFPTSASLAGVTRDDIVAMHQRYLRPQNTVVVIAGDVTVAEARATMQSTFGGWPRGGTTVTPTVPTAPATLPPTTIYLKDSPGLAQSIVFAGLLLPGRDSGDAAAIDALASVLGDFSVSSGSRVYNAFRVERGLSYSPSVQLAARPVPEMAPLGVRAQVAPAVTDTAVMMMVKVIRELRQEKPATASELDFSKRNLLGRVPTDLERVDVVGATVLASVMDRLPANYLNTWVQRIGSLGLPELQAAATKYLDPDHLTVVVVGDRAKVEAALRATGIPVVIVP